MFRKIQTKITFTYIAFALLVILTIGVVISYELEAIIAQTVEKNLLRESNYTDHYLAEISAQDAARIHANLSEHARQSGVRITLIDSAGIVLLDTDVPYAETSRMENHGYRPEVLVAQKKEYGTDIRHSRSTGHDYYYLAKKNALTPSHPALHALTYIRVSSSLEEYRHLISDVRVNIVYAGVLVLAMMFFISAFISRRITKPILTLTKEMKEIAAGDYSRHLTVSSRDEIRDLCDSVNVMSETIRGEIQELQKLSTFRAQFLANVSHEIRTPVFSIQAMLETLLNGAVKDDEVNVKYLRRAYENLERLNNLLNDLIDISMIESKEMRLSFRFFALEEILLPVIDSLREQAAAKSIGIENRVGPDIKIFGDRARLTQVFTNLLDNAVKYNPAGTTVTVEAEMLENETRVRVADNGNGIAGEHLPRIFERFYRVDKERSRENGGTGLGLAIVKHILEAHGSAIEAQSEQGKGTAFSFRLKS